MSEKFNDVMIDIESMSLHPHNALILSIGMVEFDPTSPKGLVIGERKLILPNLEEQILLRREISPDTQKFWADQPYEASAHWREYAGERPSIRNVSVDIRQFIGDGRKRVWANHILFDLGNIVGLCAQAGHTTPWHYRAPTDMPSFCNNAPLINGIDLDGDDDPRRMPDDLVYHHPVDDSIRQAYEVWRHWQD